MCCISLKAQQGAVYIAYIQCLIAKLHFRQQHASLSVSHIYASSTRWSKASYIDGHLRTWLQHDPPSKAFSITVIASCALKSVGTRSRLNSALAYRTIDTSEHTAPNLSFFFSLVIKTGTVHPHPFYSILNPLKTHCGPSGSFSIHTVRAVTISSQPSSQSVWHVYFNLQVYSASFVFKMGYP